MDAQITFSNTRKVSVISKNMCGQVKVLTVRLGILSLGETTKVLFGSLNLEPHKGGIINLW